MPTIEQFGVLCQINDQIFRLARNMRTNASQYIGAANANVDPVAIGIGMKTDASEFLRRLQQLTDIAVRNQTLVQNALGIIGVTLAQANTVKNNLAAVANHVLAATLTTKQQCIDESNAILTSADAFDGLF